MEMHKRRKVLSEPEIRYMVRQIAAACEYLHSNKIVHRDLKLGNLFLNENMEVKVGDFGLATKIMAKNERKLTLCGTPNYIAPEVLLKRGHGFEVDVWSLGCIVYTLFVGKPPFETTELKDTYKKIRNNDYSVPEEVPLDAKSLISRMLRPDPKDRPSMSDILKDPYLTKNYVPSRLPHSCLTTAPRYNNGRLSIMPTEFVTSPRKPLADRNLEGVPVMKTVAVGTESKVPVSKDAKPTKSNGEDKDKVLTRQTTRVQEMQPFVPKMPINNFNLEDLSSQLKHLVDSQPYKKKVVQLDEAEDPALSPFYWVSKWVDYTDRYGIGYQLCDNSIGILFNDATRILLLADEHNLQYIDRDGSEYFYLIENYPEYLKKKITLLKYFRNYMNEHLLKCGDKRADLEEKDELTRLPYLNNWFRTRNAIIFHLTNGTVQMNFFKDHTKLILCPHMGAVTFVTQGHEFHTYKFSLLETYGCSKSLYDRLRYARDVIEDLKKHPMQVGQRAGRH